VVSRYAAGEQEGKPVCPGDIVFSRGKNGVAGTALGEKEGERFGFFCVVISGNQVFVGAIFTIYRYFVWSESVAAAAAAQRDLAG
jgi:hypothetical protein